MYLFADHRGGPRKSRVEVHLARGLIKGDIITPMEASEVKREGSRGLKGDAGGLGEGELLGQTGKRVFAVTEPMEQDEDIHGLMGWRRRSDGQVERWGEVGRRW